MKHALHTFFRYFPVSARDRRWGLWLTTAGESRIPPGADYPPSGHPGGYQFDWHKGRTLREFQVVYISAGQGTLNIGRKDRWQIRSGDAFVLFPGSWHTYRPDPATGWNEHWVGCDGPALRALVKAGFFARKKPLLRTRNEELLLGAFTSVIDAIHAHRPALQQVMAGATLYILSLLYSAQQPGQDSRQNIAAAVHEAIRRMTEPADGDEDLEHMAKSLNISYTYFRRMFTRHTGLSPHQYRLQLKIGRARTLLADTQLTVKEVAYRSGFQSEHYFCRLFHKKTGLTPTQWRTAPTPVT